MSNISLRKTDYDNEYNLRGFYDEYLKAQEMIKEVKNLYFSFMCSKLKPLDNFVTASKIDRLKLYRYSIVHNKIRCGNYCYGWYNDNIQLYLARFIYPLIHKQLHEESKNDENCPWIYPLKYAVNPEKIKAYGCFGYIGFRSKDFYRHEFIEKKSGHECEYHICCYPSTVGCKYSCEYGYEKKVKDYRKKVLAHTIFKTEDELEDSYNKWKSKFWNRFDEIKKDIFNKYGPTIEYTNKFSIMVDTYEVINIISDMRLKKDAILPKSIWHENGIICQYIPYDGYDSSNKKYNAHYGKFLKVDFNIADFKKDDIDWNTFISGIVHNSTEKIWDYIDKEKVDNFVDDAIGDYFINYIGCYNANNKHKEDSSNLYIMYKNEPKYVCKSDEVDEFDVSISENKIICTREYTTSHRRGGPKWRPLVEETNWTVLTFDIDTNELISFNTGVNHKEVSY